ncbi:hypothetical protein B0H17DRAFT_1204266 [Mycena rosella]|uniref:Uncharacterized protein n=1 Tax=Mycena rosella TaxID=1033263 RepID=A0AAD7GG22_MYCRO|nr:hypothetical protein B0H17DRAFT_1204266 [Mycena rosella]
MALPQDSSCIPGEIITEILNTGSALPGGSSAGGSLPHLAAPRGAFSILLFPYPIYSLNSEQPPPSTIPPDCLQDCLIAVPFLIPLKLEAANGQGSFVFDCPAPVGVLSHLRALMISTTGPLNYKSLMLMPTLRQTTPLRTIRVNLDARDNNVYSFEDGVWLPGELLRNMLEQLAPKLYIETPDRL